MDNRESLFRELLVDYKDACDEWYGDAQEYGLNLIKRCEAALSQQAEPDGWIPCEERLPDDGVEVRIKLIGDDVIEDAVQQHNGDFYADVGGNEIFICASNVTHWMPTNLVKPVPPDTE